MRRWNGWGEERIVYPLASSARRFLAEQMGPGTPPRAVPLEEVVAQVPPPVLPPHPLVTADPEQRVRHALGQSLPDWIAARFGTLSTFPDGVAFPTTNEEVQDLIAYARRVGARIIPYGGGTSVVGHLTVLPEHMPALSVDMGRMNRLLQLEEENRLATFQAGVRGPDLEAFLRARGFTLGHFPQSFQYSTLGGWVATRSTGQESLKYGRMEALFAGGRVETPVGTLMLPPFPGSAAGPDLRHLVLGSEGRLGILTEVTVRVHPLPQRATFQAVFFPDFPHGVAAVREMAQARVPVNMLRLSTATETAVLLALAGREQVMRVLARYLALRGLGPEKCLLLVGTSGTRAEVKQTLKTAFAIARAHRGVPGIHQVAREWARNRFRSPYLRNTLWDMGYAVDTVETATTWDRVPGTIRAVEEALRHGLADIGERVLVFTHLSHVYAQGSSIYTTFLFRLAPTAEETLARWEALKAGVSYAILTHGGTISHQHGVGLDHAPYLEAEKGPHGMAAMRALFRALDPEGIMNPGKTVAGRG